MAGDISCRKLQDREIVFPELSRHALDFTCAMERLLQVLPDKPQPLFVRFAATTAIMVLCCGIQLRVYTYAGFTGFFLLLPGIFAGILRDVDGNGVAVYLSPTGNDARAAVPTSLLR